MYTQKDKDSFFEAVDTLKKYRRAELTDQNGNDLLKDLYTDLLPNEQILKTCLKDNTTFLIGRKGTGKSTIFLKIQQELRNKSNYLSCYVDTKTVYETSQSEYTELEYLKNLVPKKIIEKYLIERTFIQSVLSDIRKEMDKKSYSILDRIKKSLGTDKSDIVKEKLKNLQQKIDNNEVLKNIEIPLLTQIAIDTKDIKSISKKKGLNAGVKDASVNLGINVLNNQKQEQEIQNKFSDIFIRVFQIKEIIQEIKELLSLLGIKNLIILLDDFSEIDDISLRTFVDVILAPLNNWSEDFIKFKVAAYPNRIPYGKIERGKVDIIDLDFYNLYSEFGRDTMEERAEDFTKRLIEKRVNHFTNKPIEYFFDISKENMDFYYELIFQISMNVPRVIGYILFYCYQSNIVFDKPINKSSLESAAEKYYEKVIEPFFGATTYSLMAIDEKVSTLQLKELLESFMTQSKSIKRKILKGELTGDAYDKKNPFVSHFYFMPAYEQFIRTLELNFFISKYNEMSDRDGTKVSIYSLNYGLCVVNNLKWGKPHDYRKYFIERPFNYNRIMDDFLNKSKKIDCINPDCNQSFSMDKLEFLQFNKMLCPECHSPVKITPISNTIKRDIEKINKSKLLHPIEYSILHEINQSEIPLRAKEIAEELDCSYQLVGKKAKKMDEDMDLLDRIKDGSNNRVYCLTPKAQSEYFVVSN